MGLLGELVNRKLESVIQSLSVLQLKKPQLGNVILSTELEHLSQAATPEKFS